MPIAICQEDYDELKRQLDQAEADGERMCVEIGQLRAALKECADELRAWNSYEPCLKQADALLASNGEQKADG